MWRYLVLLVTLVFSSTVSAHPLDEYLQATLVEIEPDVIRLQINLTPGVAIADKVLPLIDRDRDGVISTNEAAAYGELLKRDLSVRLDERNMELRLTALNFPEPAELRTGSGIIQVAFSMAPGSLVDGRHRLAFENRHLPNLSLYLFNAALPKSGSVQITKQKRNEIQSEGGIEFDFHAPMGFSKKIGIGVLLCVVMVVVFAGAWRAGRSSTIAKKEQAETGL
jgi:hypothetical protein